MKSSAAVLWLGSVGLGISAPLVATYLLGRRALPTLMGIRLFGGGWFERWSPETFALLLGLFTALCAFQVFVGWLIWNDFRLGAVFRFATLPLELVFWIGFELPFPPIGAAVRLALLAMGWSALRQPTLSQREA